MILRGTQIQRDGHGRCGLLPYRTLSKNKADLPPPGVLAHTGTKLHNLWPLSCGSLSQEVAELVRL